MPLSNFILGVISVLVVMPDGQLRVFTEEEALSRALSGEQAFVQALGHALPERAKTYLEITQHRDGNTTTDAEIERVELGR